MPPWCRALLTSPASAGAALCETLRREIPLAARGFCGLDESETPCRLLAARGVALRSSVAARGRTGVRDFHLYTSCAGAELSPICHALGMRTVAARSGAARQEGAAVSACGTPGTRRQPGRRADREGPRRRATRRARLSGALRLEPPDRSERQHASRAFSSGLLGANRAATMARWAR